MAFRLPATLRLVGVRFMASGSGMGDFGSGAGKGGGSGGSVREAGGAFGKREAAQEEMYFRKLEREQFSKLRKHLEDEVAYHKDQIDEHKESIERHKKKIQKLQHQEKDIDN